MKRALTIIALAATASFAQEPAKLIQHTEEVTLKVDASQSAPGQPVTVTRTIGPMLGVQRFSSAPVKGAPYSAEAVTESVQALADGNRIVNKQTSKMYRDSEGRTRTENNLESAGTWLPEMGKMSLTMIYDPVSGENYTLNNSQKTAVKMVLPKFTAKGVGGVGVAPAHAVAVERTVTLGPGPAVISERVGGGVVASAGSGVAYPKQRLGLGSQLKHEDLGKQVIEGVQCDGMRDTQIIPVGAVGNEREIQVVTERWFSPELGMEMLRKSSDPRSGETTYRVIQLVRSEQPRSLFEIPPDYKIEEMGAGVAGGVPGGVVELQRKVEKVEKK